MGKCVTRARKFCLGLFLVAIPATAAGAPAIVGNAKDLRCRETLRMATKAFYSKNSSLLWPIPAPSARTKIVLSQSLKDISGGYALKADPAEFALIRRTTPVAAHPTIFWGRRISAGKRIALVDEPFGWKGDIYSLFLLEAGVAPQPFADQVEAQIDGGHFLDGVFGEVRRDPPIILMDNRSREHWIIDRGELYEVMGDWTVHSVRRKGLVAPCRITFGSRPDRALERLPASVRTLAAALDEALGPEENEGTLQPTARIRSTVAKGWANTVFRPWALTDFPYNSRSEVERGLVEWAKHNGKRAVLLRRIRATYPAAERALAGYYAGRFRNPGRLAHHALDYMFRNYFVFHGQGPPDPDEMVRPN